MDDMNKEYLKTDYDDLKVVKSEIFLTPMLIILPLLVGVFFVYDWFYRDYSLGVLDLDGHLMFGVVILIGNIMFDIPFIKSLIRYRRNKKRFDKKMV
jgi:hypothetical protein